MKLKTLILWFLIGIFLGVGVGFVTQAPGVKDWTGSLWPDLVAPGNAEEINAQLVAELAEKNTAIATLLEEKSTLTLSLENANATIVIREGQLANLNAQLLQLAQDYDALLLSKNILQSEIAGLQSVLNIANGNVNSLTLQLQAKENELTALNVQLQQLADVQQQLTTAQNALTAALLQLDQNANLITNLNNQIAQKNMQITELQNQLAEAVDPAELLAQIAALEIARDNLQDDLADAQSELAAKQNIIDNLEDIIADLENDLIGFEELQNNFTALQNDLANLQTLLNVAENNLITLQNTITSQALEITNLQNDLNAAQNEIASLNAQIQPLQNEIAELQDDVAGLQSELNAKQNTIENLQNEVAELQAQLADLQEQLNNVIIYLIYNNETYDIINTEKNATITLPILSDFMTEQEIEADEEIGRVNHAILIINSLGETVTTNLATKTDVYFISITFDQIPVLTVYNPSTGDRETVFPEDGQTAEEWAEQWANENKYTKDENDNFTYDTVFYPANDYNPTPTLVVHTTPFVSESNIIIWAYSEHFDLVGEYIPEVSQYGIQIHGVTFETLSEGTFNYVFEDLDIWGNIYKAPTGFYLLTFIGDYTIDVFPTVENDLTKVSVSLKVFNGTFQLFMPYFLFVEPQTEYAISLAVEVTNDDPTNFTGRARVQDIFGSPTYLDSLISNPVLENVIDVFNNVVRLNITGNTAGYNFIGWFVNDDLVTTNTFEITENTHFVARFEKIATLQLTTTVNGGTIAEAGVVVGIINASPVLHTYFDTYSATVPVGETMILQATTFDGYRLKYWNINGTLFFDTMIEIDVDENLTITALFEKLHEINVTLNTPADLVIFVEENGQVVQHDAHSYTIYAPHKQFEGGAFNLTIQAYNGYIIEYVNDNRPVGTIRSNNYISPTNWYISFSNIGGDFDVEISIAE